MSHEYPIREENESGVIEVVWQDVPTPYTDKSA